MKLRDYQQAAVEGIYEWFGSQDGNPLVVVPTGGGKSLIIAAFIRGVIKQWPDQRFMVATHVKELVEQNYNQFVGNWGGIVGCPAGIYSASAGRRETRQPVTFCSVQSVYRRAGVFGKVDLLIVDEAHLIPPRGFGMYQQLIAELRAVNPKLRVIGLTATPFRTDSGELDKGDDAMFHGTAYEVEVVDLIEAGWLSRVTNQATKAEIDISGVHTRAGDYVEKELAEAAMRGDLVARTVTELVERAAGRRSWLLFCANVDHAEAVGGELIDRGIVTTAVFGTTATADRDRRVAEFRAGRIKAMVNVNVLTTGFDAPGVDLIAMLRPTKSPGLYVQMVGRGLRLAPGKSDCLVLDFGGNVMRHGPIDCVNVRQPRRSGETCEAPTKKCPKCDRLVGISAKVCSGCGYEWEEKVEDAHEDTPDTDSMLLRGRSRFEKWDVSRVLYHPWKKIDKPTMLRVTYQCGFKRDASEWVCFEHTGFARKKAEMWWKARAIDKSLPPPETVDIARVRIELGQLYAPLRITVDNTGDYPEIKSVRMADDEPGIDNEGPAPRGVDTADIPF